MRSLTPLEKAIIRGIRNGLDSRDKLKKEFKYFDSLDIDDAVDNLIEMGLVKSEIKGLIRKKEKLSLTSSARTTTRAPRSTPARSPRIASGSSRGYSGSYSGAYSGSSYYRERIIERDRYYDDEDYDNRELADEEREEGFLDRVREEVSEIKEEIEDKVDDIVDDVEDTLGLEDEEDRE